MESDELFRETTPNPKPKRLFGILRRPQELPPGTNLLGSAVISPNGPPSPTEPAPAEPGPKNVTSYLVELAANQKNSPVPGPGGPPTGPTREQREEDYRLKRAKIFGSAEEDSKEEEEERKPGRGGPPSECVAKHAQCYFYPPVSEHEQKRGRPKGTGQQTQPQHPQPEWDEKYQVWFSDVQNSNSSSPAGPPVYRYSPLEAPPKAPFPPPLEAPAFNPYAAPYVAPPYPTGDPSFFYGAPAYPPPGPVAYPPPAYGYPYAPMVHHPPEEPPPPPPSGAPPSPLRSPSIEGVYEDNRGRAVDFDENFPPLD